MEITISIGKGSRLFQDSLLLYFFLSLSLSLLAFLIAGSKGKVANDINNKYINK